MQAGGWGGDYDTKEYIFLKNVLVSFTVMIHCRIQNSIHKLINTKTYIQHQAKRKSFGT